VAIFVLVTKRTLNITLFISEVALLAQQCERPSKRSFAFLLTVGGRKITDV
jgi:hypothetical protein